MHLKAWLSLQAACRRGALLVNHLTGSIIEKIIFYEGKGYYMHVRAR
jgi:hypothetical protein